MEATGIPVGFKTERYYMMQSYSVHLNKKQESISVSVRRIFDNPVNL